jgi:hypothetical protein
MNQYGPTQDNIAIRQLVFRDVALLDARRTRHQIKRTVIELRKRILSPAQISGARIAYRFEPVPSHYIRHPSSNVFRVLRQTTAAARRSLAAPAAPALLHTTLDRYV